MARNVVVIGALGAVSAALIAVAWCASWVWSGAWLGGPIPSPQERIEVFWHLPHRSRPLIAAINQFHADHGSPPKELQELVPDYLPAIPDTGVARFPSCQYKVFPLGGTMPVVWYDLGPADKGVRPSEEYGMIGPRGNAVLVVRLFLGDRISRVEPVRLAADSGARGFDVELWRSDKNSRKEMVASLSKDVSVKTMRWPDLIGMLGEPDGMGFLWERPWELSVDCYWGFWESSRLIYWPTEKYPRIDHYPSTPLGNWLFMDTSI